jgi:hypothetical protein
MKTINDLVEAVFNGQKPVVTFRSLIDDKDGYAEAGMRARAISATRADAHGVITVKFDFEEFDAHNAPLESSNYYDKDGNATLTAKQAGYYHPCDDIYFDTEELLKDLLEMESSAAISLYHTFVAEAPGCSYVQWLERKVLDAAG